MLNATKTIKDRFCNSPYQIEVLIICGVNQMDHTDLGGTYSQIELFECNFCANFKSPDILTR